MAKNKCWICGIEESDDVVLVDWNGKELNCPNAVWYRRYCRKCKKDLEIEDRELQGLYVKLKKRAMFIMACNRLESQGVHMYECRDAILKVQNNIESHPDNYDSSYEVMAAIVLIQHGMRIKMQCKVGRYQVDILIPKLKVIVEIDGDRHKHHKERDSNRDARIISALGDDWNVIRIKTEFMDKDAFKLIDAIQNVIEYRKTGKVNWRKLYDEP